MPNGRRYRKARYLEDKATRRRIRRLPRVLGGVGAAYPKLWAKARTGPVHAVLADLLNGITLIWSILQDDFYHLVLLGKELDLPSLIGFRSHRF